MQKTESPSPPILTKSPKNLNQQFPKTSSLPELNSSFRLPSINASHDIYKKQNERYPNLQKHSISNKSLLSLFQPAKKPKISESTQKLLKFKEKNLKIKLDDSKLMTKKQMKPETFNYEDKIRLILDKVELSN